MENTLFESEHLYFRAFNDSDLMTLHELLSSERVMYYCSGFMNLAGTEKWLSAILRYYKRYGYDYFAVYERNSNQFVGQIGIIRETIEGIDRDCLAYMIKEDYWGRGLAIEGARRCIRYATNDLNINSLYATVDANNLPSIKVLEKLDFTFSHQKKEDEAILVYRLIERSNEIK